MECPNTDESVSALIRSLIDVGVHIGEIIIHTLEYSYVILDMEKTSNINVIKYDRVAGHIERTRLCDAIPQPANEAAVIDRLLAVKVDYAIAHTVNLRVVISDTGIMVTVAENGNIRDPDKDKINALLAPHYKVFDCIDEYNYHVTRA